MRLGIPDAIRACLFDLDGVLTQTAKVHAAAWKTMFDEYLGPDRAPFDKVTDYDEYVDGKPRDDGTRSFLAARGIELADDEIHRLGLRKNELVLRMIHDQGVQPYEGSVRYLRAVTTAGLPCAVVSSSTNCKDVLEAAGIEDFFAVRIDGNVAHERGLAGKPAPDTFLAAAKELGVEAAQATVYEDALAGVEAGRAGDFGFVVGVDRVGQADQLRKHGADIVVEDLAELLAADA